MAVHVAVTLLISYARSRNKTKITKGKMRVQTSHQEQLHFLFTKHMIIDLDADTIMLPSFDTILISVMW